MDPRTALSRSRGIARSAALAELGVSRHAIDRGLAAGLLVRPRRGWIALPDTDPELLSAAEHGAILSCITQARRLGLWVHREDRPHLGSRTPVTHTSAPGCKIHWGTPLLPRDPHVLEDSLENVLGYVAACQPWESALAIWESALNKRLTTLSRLARLPYTGSARRLIQASTPFSDSGVESIFRTRLRWLRIRIVSQAWIDGHRVDFLIGERLVVQIDGGTHVGPQRTSDNQHDARLHLNGYHVIRVGTWQVLEDWPAVQSSVMSAIAQGFHLGSRP